MYSITNMPEGLWHLTHINTTYHCFPDSLVTNKLYPLKIMRSTLKLYFYYHRVKAIPIKCFVSHRPPSREGGSVGRAKKKGMNTWRVLSASEGRKIGYVVLSFVIRWYNSSMTTKCLKRLQKQSINDLRWFPSKRSHHRFPMKLGMLMLQDKEILKT